MKQKILYILVLITAWIGGSGLVWAQYGYISHTSNTIVFEKTKTDLTVNNNRMTISNTTQLDNQSIKVTFTLGDNVLSNQGGACNLTIRGTKTNEFKWSLDDYYCINLTKLGANLTASWSETMTFTSSDGKSVSQKVGWSDNDIELTGMNLNEAGKITLQTTGNDNYIHRLTYTYTLSYYELDVTALESAISAAKNTLSSITDETMKGYLNTAITYAESFMKECAFPNSYWNGSSVGNTPAEVNAITNYLSAYQSALNTIASAENSFDKTNDQKTLTADIKNAKAQLEQATSVEEINSALANIKKFDSISFNGSTELQEGASIEKPAKADSPNTISYSSSNPDVIDIDGTTLKAVGAGEVTITASTTTGDGYYGYTTSQTYTVKPNAITLVPDAECNIVENVTYPQITLQRTFSAGKHYTLTLPFDTKISDFSDNSEAYAAQLSLVTYNKADGYTLYFKKVDGGRMSANQPYVVYLLSIKDSFTWTDVTVAAPTAEAIEVNNWTMQGNYTREFKMEGKYGIANGVLCKGEGENAKINAYTAYFIPPTNSLGTEKIRARVAVMDGSGNTTYIGELSDLNTDAVEEVFGIDGMRLPEVRKGINIVRQKDGSVRKIVK